MYEYFARLRRLPEAARRKRALLISSAVTLLILAIWGIFLYMRINDGMFSAKSESREANAPGIIETFSDFFSGIGGVFNGGETYENTAGTYEGR